LLLNVFIASSALNCSLIRHKAIAQKGFSQIENVPSILKMLLHGIKKKRMKANQRLLIATANMPPNVY